MGPAESRRSFMSTAVIIGGLGKSDLLDALRERRVQLNQAAEGLFEDLLVHEVSEATDEMVKANPRLGKALTFHTRAVDAGTIFTRVHPKLAVYSHLNARGMTREELVQRTRSTYKGPLVVGEV